MATINKARLEALIKSATKNIPAARREAAKAANADLERRQASMTILNPNEVSGEYDAGRLLQTTLRGEIRTLTHADLRAFQQNVQRLKKRYKGGITAQAVIDQSLPADRERANKQIRMATPVSIRGGEVHFITNAGPDSDVARHHVNINFLDFEAAVGASPNQPNKIAKLVTDGRLQFECDCGRHTFWYRYIATVGKYNFGRAETGFPKIRNPNLRGVACKHVLRVMHVILKDKVVATKIANSVLKARDVLDRSKLKAEKLKADEIRKLAAQQAAKGKTASTLRTSEDKQAAATKRKAKAAMKAAVAPPVAKPSKASAQVERHARKLLDLGAITQEQFDQIIKAAK